MYARAEKKEIRVSIFIEKVISDLLPVTWGTFAGVDIIVALEIRATAAGHLQNARQKPPARPVVCVQGPVLDFASALEMVPARIPYVWSYFEMRA